MKPTTLVAIIIVLLIPIAALMFTRSNSADSSATPTPSPSASQAETKDPDDAVTASKVILKTSKGDITINLYKDSAPKSVKNFVTLGKRGYYNNVVFHRIIADFMIQSGDPTGTGGESIYGRGFEVEQTGKPFVKGSIGMARSSDPNSNGSQFFIVTQSAQTSLDKQYTNFGEIDPASQSVVDAIAATPVKMNSSGTEVSAPTEEVKITGFEIVE